MLCVRTNVESALNENILVKCKMARVIHAMLTDDVDVNKRHYESANIDIHDLESRLGKTAHPLLSVTYDAVIKPSHQLGILKTYKNLVLKDIDAFHDEVKDDLSNLRKLKENIDTQKGVKRYVNAQKSLLRKDVPSDHGFMYLLEKQRKKKATKANKVKEVEKVKKTKKTKTSPSPDTMDDDSVDESVDDPVKKKKAKVVKEVKKTKKTKAPPSPDTMDDDPSDDPIDDPVKKKKAKVVKEVKKTKKTKAPPSPDTMDDDSVDDPTDFRFNTEEECKSAKRSKPYYTQKKDLLDIISKNSKLKPQFPRISKMSKDEICDKLFEVARKN